MSNVFGSSQNSYFCVACKRRIEQKRNVYVCLIDILILQGQNMLVIAKSISRESVKCDVNHGIFPRFMLLKVGGKLRCKHGHLSLSCALFLCFLCLVKKVCCSVVRSLLSYHSLQMFRNWHICQQEASSELFRQ